MSAMFCKKKCISLQKNHPNFMFKKQKFGRKLQLP